MITKKRKGKERKKQKERKERKKERGQKLPETKVKYTTVATQTTKR